MSNDAHVDLDVENDGCHVTNGMKPTGSHDSLSVSLYCYYRKAENDAESDKDALTTAAVVADANQAHLTAVCLGLDRTNPGAYYAGANTVLLHESLKTAQEEAAATEDAVNAVNVRYPSWGGQSMTTTS